MYTKKTQNKKLVIVSLLVLIVVMTIACITFMTNLHKVTHSETERYLAEISENVSATINVKHKSIVMTLYSIGETYLQFCDTSEKVNSLLLQKVKTLDYDWISITDSNGNSIDSKGNTSSMIEQDFYQKALQGEETINSIKSESGIQGILYAVPLYKNDKIVGVIASWNTMDKVRELLSVDIFGGEGFSQIVDQNGNYIVYSVNKNAPRNVTNFFSLMKEHGTYNGGSTPEEMKLDLKNQKRGFMNFTLDDGISKEMHYIPLEGGNLYLLSNVPTKIASAQFDILLKKTLGINILIITLFLSLIILVIFINYRNSKHLIKLAYVDPITQGYSKARFDMEATSAINSASVGAYSMISIDIKKFKLINDTFGSNAGDKTLHYVHNVINKYVNKDELLCRVSSDNFNILIKTITQEEVLQYIENITEDINSFNKTLEQKYFISLSVGVYIIDDPNIPLVSIRDRSNVARKNDSGNAGNHPLYTCVFYSDLERLKMLREKEMENRMDKALDNEEFVVYLQPKVALKENKIMGAEALVRWQDPVKGLIPPNDFIPFFEKNRFIIKLDHYVFDKACAMLRKWIDNGETPVPISVNFSRAHLDDPDFLKNYRKIREKYDVPAKLLEIELTETLIFENLEILLKVIDQIHEEGYQCSIDDFGSGYSSLNMLKNIKVDTLKLDRAFFSSPEADNISENHVIESVVELAKKLNMNSISEGVETVSQMEHLKKIDCDMVQGYVFSKPIPQEIFEKMTFGKVISDIKVNNTL